MLVRDNIMKLSMSLKYFEIISFISVVFDFLMNLRSTYPGNVVLHISRHVEGRICYGVDPNLNMPLLDVHHRIFYCLGHLHSLHHHWQSSSGKGTHCDFFAWCQALSRVYHSHLVQLISHLVCFGDSIFVIRF